MALYETSKRGYRGFLIVDGRLVSCIEVNLDFVPTITISRTIYGNSIEFFTYRSYPTEGQKDYTAEITIPFYQEGDKYSPNDNSWWDVFLKWAYTDRVSPKDIIVSPDGACFYTYKDAYVSRFSIEGGIYNEFIQVTLVLNAKSRSKKNLRRIWILLLTNQCLTKFQFLLGSQKW